MYVYVALLFTAAYGNLTKLATISMMKIIYTQESYTTAQSLQSATDVAISWPIGVNFRSPDFD